MTSSNSLSACTSTPSPLPFSLPLDKGMSITNLDPFLVNNTTTSALTSEILSRTIPTLSSKSHKGSSGRVLILGGSAKYTGAPYYAAMSALQTGCDLVTIHCAKEALIPLKSYSPELMVEGVYSAYEFDGLIDHHVDSSNNHHEEDMFEKEEIQSKVNDMVRKVTSSFQRMHAIIIGPGLGRCPIVMKATAIIIQEAMKQNLNIVLDADGLYLLSLQENKDIFSSSLNSNNCGNDDDCNSSSSAGGTDTRIVLTPNVVEYQRLVDSMGEGSEELLREKLQGVTIVRKGAEDHIELISKEIVEDAYDDVDDGHSNSSNSIQKSMICNEKGGLKRSGGIGDVLAGSVGTFLAWNRILSRKKSNNDNVVMNKNDVDTNGDDDIILASWMACCLTKKSTARAFQKKKRSMTAPDILDEIGAVFDEVASSTIEQ